MGIPLLGILHDWSKFLPDEFIPYSRHKFKRDKTGYYKPADTGDTDFETAFFLHVRRNKHHWQSWCVPVSLNCVMTMPIPERYMREMVADWRGAGKAQGTPDTKVWYATHKDDLVLHLESRKWIEELLGE